MNDIDLHAKLRSTSFLEYAFLRWVLGPASLPGLEAHVVAQQPAEVHGRSYLIDYELVGETERVAVELDGFEFHGTRSAFTYDRFRQNDLAATGRSMVRFTYDGIRSDTRRCVVQLQTILATDTRLARFINPNPRIEVPEMNPDPLHALDPTPWREVATEEYAVNDTSYFDQVRTRLNHKTLRLCQREAFSALANYYGGGGSNAACVMSVGAGKTALGVLASLAFTRRRTLIVTPGRVIRGTFDRAWDHQAVGNVLYGLPGGPLIPGSRPPNVLTLDREGGAIRSITREQLLAADVIVTNFHSLGNGTDPDDLLAKLNVDDIDLIVVDEAHIAAAESYQRLFSHFADARTLLMSACFQRLDGKPIDADVVYRYRLVDSIADGNAKNLRVHRFAPDSAATTYELVWPDGAREEIVGRDELLKVIADDHKLARITAKSNEPIRQMMRLVRAVLDAQTELLHPVKPRVLFAALGERHAEQIARIAEEHGIPCATLHHSQTDAHIKRTRQRFESDTGDLQGIAQLKMLAQGYDFPPICVVVPLRAYGSFNEFYQFIGRGIRVLHHPALLGRVGPEQQFLDIIYHAEFGLDDHIDTIYLENDMDPHTVHALPDAWQKSATELDVPGTRGHDVAGHPDAFVLFERGATEARVVHDESRIEAHRDERELAAMAQRYAEYAAGTDDPVNFQQFVNISRQFRE
ncbi:DEAD/DEAH box helicase family protein [Rhodococcus sp. D-46]|uniref:DEAD/DEAH box helicase family protein n=1 Tax=unclassified Rhodococcus (in: high G+C Gram-positive bacteria) TaxID=192944 RepID=UPI0006BA2F6D|nr:DEAD/DEAH box helicase family protein [Rhodococcus sp. ADH]KPH21402.1 restriction endonuclease subunit R [Rhodococcus sp. ADH]NHE68822.1 DEAD/DEAH box helicase family protein [Rhodococcus sp. D-46]RGP46705.1 restriction endonuclease subunit R [Rhodococcus erythropolis]